MKKLIIILFLLVFFDFSVNAQLICFDFPADMVALYPNPGNGFLRILSDPPIADLEVAGIFDCLGMASDDCRYSQSGQYFDLSSLKSGLYIIHCRAGNKSIYKKDIIN
jgi:hypothetical protein